MAPYHHRFEGKTGDDGSFDPTKAVRLVRTKDGRFLSKEEFTEINRLNRLRFINRLLNREEDEEEDVEPMELLELYREPGQSKNLISARDQVLPDGGRRMVIFDINTKHLDIKRKVGNVKTKAPTDGAPELEDQQSHCAS